MGEAEEYAAALGEAAAASARLGVALGRWKVALDRLGAATKGLADVPTTAREEANRQVALIIAAETEGSEQRG